MVTENPDIINFHDYAGALKFTVKLENIYYIKAEGNYVNVFYNNKGGVSLDIIDIFELHGELQRSGVVVEVDDVGVLGVPAS